MYNTLVFVNANLDVHIYKVHVPLLLLVPVYSVYIVMPQLDEGHCYDIYVVNMRERRRNNT